jgi:hypothetical protein
MKRQFLNVLKKVSLLCAILLATVIASAQGQTLGSRVKANIPFDFTIGDKKLPSGKYTLGRARQFSDDVMISVEDQGGRSKVIRTSIPVLARDTTQKPKLVFHRYGDQYFLYQVWPAGATTGRQLPKSRGERDLEEHLGANPSVGNLTAKFSVVTVTITGSRD